jgi:hypothetical protein
MGLPHFIYLGRMARMNSLESIYSRSVPLV